MDSFGRLVVMSWVLLLKLIKKSLDRFNQNCQKIVSSPEVKLKDKSRSQRKIYSPQFENKCQKTPFPGE